MSLVVCEVMFKLFIAYLCFMNLSNIMAKREFAVKSQYKTFLGIPYGTEKILEVQELEYQYTIPIVAALLACLGSELLHSICSLFVSTQNQLCLRYLMIKVFWLFKVLWLVIYMLGFTSILLSHHELYLIAYGLQLESAFDLLLCYKFQFVWQSIVFLVALICWTEEDKINRNYYKLLLHEGGYAN